MCWHQRYYCATVDIQKAFHSVNHQFLSLALKRYGLGKTFIKWIQTLLNSQKSCIRGEGHTTKNFKLEKGTGQGDPISAYFLILVLDIMLNLIKEKKDIHSLNFLEHMFFYTAYADDTNL